MNTQEFLQNFMIGLICIFLSFLVLFGLITVVHRWPSSRREGFQNPTANDPEFQSLLKSVEDTLMVSKWPTYCAIFAKVKEGIENGEKADSVTPPGPPRGMDKDNQSFTTGDTVTVEMETPFGPPIKFEGKVVAINPNKKNSFDVETQEGKIVTGVKSKEILLKGESKIKEIAMKQDPSNIPSVPPSTLTPAQLSEKVTLFLKKNVKGGEPVMCPLDFPRSQLTSYEDLYRYVNNLSVNFLADLYSTQLLFSQLMAEQIKKIKDATSPDVQGFDGNVPLQEVEGFAGQEDAVCCKKLETKIEEEKRKEEPPSPPKETIQAEIPKKLATMKSKLQERISAARFLVPNIPDSLEKLMTLNQQLNNQLETFKKQAEDGTLPHPQANQKEATVNL